MPMPMPSSDAYEQFLAFQRMQWEQLKEFQQLHAAQPTASQPSQDLAHPPDVRSIPFRPDSRSFPSISMPSQSPLCKKPVPPAPEASIPHKSPRKRQPTSVQDLLRSVFGGVASPSQNPHPSKPQSPRVQAHNTQQSSSSPISPSEKLPELPKAVPVTGSVPPPAPASPAKPAAPVNPLEHFEKLSEELESVAEQIKPGCHYSELQGMLMKIILALDEAPCSPLLRTVRKALVARTNEQLDALDRIQDQAEACQEDESGTVLEVSNGGEQASASEPQAQEMREDENLTAEITERIMEDVVQKNMTGKLASAEQGSSTDDMTPTGDELELGLSDVFEQLFVSQEA